MFWNAQKRGLDLCRLPELESRGKELGRESGRRSDAAKITMRQIGACAPAKAIARIGSEREAAQFATQVEAGEDGRGAGEAVAQRPVLVAQIDGEGHAVFRAGPGEFRIGTPLRGVPAQERCEVDCFMGDVVVPGVDALEGQVAQ
jgi:hypothetical protein